MTIRHQLTVSAWTFGVVIVAVFVTLVLSSHEVDRALRRSQSAADITTNGISGLREVTVDYILHHEERALGQWQQRHASLQGMLARGVYDDSDGSDFIGFLRQRNEYLGEIFPRLINIYVERSRGAIPDSLQREVEARLVTQVMVTTQEMISAAARLTQRSQDRLREAQRRANLIVWIEVAVMALLIALNLVLAVRVVLNPIRVLQHGTEIVGAGDLTHRTNIGLNNEIGALSRSFDAMTAKLSQSQAKLERNALRLEDAVHELEAFSYSVSHDLRAPLRGIDGWSLALLEDCGPQLDEKGRGYIGIVRAETQRMGQLIDDLLQLSRVSRGELERAPVDLSELAQVISLRLKESYPQRQIEFLIEPGLAANADRRLLEIALTNLLGNACKFTGPRPAARVEFGRNSVPDPATQRPTDAFFVRDNGVGFDMAQVGKLFGAFQRLHPASEFPGTGIGLATVQRIVSRHDGRIWAESQPGRGASFYFTFEETT